MQARAREEAACGERNFFVKAILIRPLLSRSLVLERPSTSGSPSRRHLTWVEGYDALGVSERHGCSLESGNH